MSVYTMNLLDWWNALSEEWKQVLIQAMDLEDCFQLTDVEYLFTITDLTCFGISDLSPLLMLPQLEVLHLGHCSVTDFSPLRALSRLKELHLTYCNELDAGILSGLGHLQILDLSYPQLPIQNQAELEHLKQLKEVYMNGCELSSLQPFLRMQGLNVLCAYFNPLSEAEVFQFRTRRPKCELMV